jgi:rubrerythrin
MRKTPKPNVARILYDAYPDSDLLPLDADRDCRNLQVLLEKVRSTGIGDTLFEFLVTEVVEGSEGTLEGAIRVVKRARKDVDAVLQSLVSTRAEHLKESPKDANRTSGPYETHLGIWRCRDCRRAVYRTHRKIAKSGPPPCPGCGQPMQLA